MADSKENGKRDLGSEGVNTYCKSMYIKFVLPEKSLSALVSEILGTQFLKAFTDTQSYTINQL